MRLSLMKAAHVVASFAAWQEIRVRSGRDLRFLFGLASLKVSNTEEQVERYTTEDDERSQQ